jgi:hypothetical protein
LILARDVGDGDDRGVVERALEVGKLTPRRAVLGLPM